MDPRVRGHQGSAQLTAYRMRRAPFDLLDLGPQNFYLYGGMDQAVLAEIKQMEADGKYESPRYVELLVPHHYVHHILRMPYDSGRTP